MITTLTDVHRQRLQEISKKLMVLGPHEGNFIKVELLFFEAMQIAKEYGTDASENELLQHLKEVQATTYEQTNGLFKKRSQRESTIRRFMAGFRKVIATK